MKNLLTGLMLASLFLVATPAEARGVTHVSSYYKPTIHKTVTSYYKTTANHTKLDNFSTKGNYNPYTGKMGTKKAY